VTELEDALAKLRNQQPPETTEGTPSSVASTEASSSYKPSSRKDEEPGQDQDLARDFEGLNVEHDGRISFHGPTSLFQLPSGALNSAASSSQLAMQAGERKERLIKNAWRERAIEQMATMPVRVNDAIPPPSWTNTHCQYRSRFNTYLIHTGAGSNHSSTLSTDLHLPVCSFFCAD
jgi:hypothetical protein